MKKRSFLYVGLCAIILAASGFALSQSGIPTASHSLQKYVDELPLPPSIKVQDDQLNINLTQFSLQLHRDLPAVAAWGYNGSSPGPTIEVESNQKVQIHWKNELPTTHIFATPSGSMDTDLPDVRNVTHLHGAIVTESDPMNRVQNNDGWPDAWNVSGQEQMAEYPNKQSARTLWYHDHAIGETGRNVAAGLVGLYEIHDPYERSLNLPKGKFEIPLVFQSQAVVSGARLYSKDITVEFYGNYESVNGKIYPFLNVEPRKYRFRFVNASNARTLAMKLIDSTDQSSGPAFYQIGTDSGFLQDTAVLNDPADPSSIRLTMAPAERADVIIDFSQYKGRNFILKNNSITDPDGELQIPELMMFKVGTTLSEVDTSSLPIKMATIEPIKEKDASNIRTIKLTVMTMADGSTMQMINGKMWRDPVDEKPILGSTEIWQIVNGSRYVHPLHVHLVQFQILDRTPFDPVAYEKDGSINVSGPVELPDPNERGWKDVVRASPYHTTRIIMRFGPYTGHYVYHCHILEHEDMDMMRPFDVVAPTK